MTVSEYEKIRKIGQRDRLAKDKGKTLKSIKRKDKVNVKGVRYKRVKETKEKAL